MVFFLAEDEVSPMSPFFLVSSWLDLRPLTWDSLMLSTVFFLLLELFFHFCALFLHRISFPFHLSFWTRRCSFSFSLPHHCCCSISSYFLLITSSPFLLHSLVFLPLLLVKSFPLVQFSFPLSLPSCSCAVRPSRVVKVWTFFLRNGPTRFFLMVSERLIGPQATNGFF